MGNMKKTILVVALLSAASGAASSAEIYGGLNLIQGYTVGANQTLTNQLAVRMETNYLNYSKDNIDIDEVNWNGTVKNKSIGVFADYHPFEGNFFLTGGLNFGKYKVNAHGVSSSGNYVINGTSYDATGEYLNGSVTSPSVRPYLGLGWGHTPNSGLGAYFNAGVYYGKLKYKIDASSTLAALASDDISQAQNNGQDTLDNYKFMPSIAFGLSYSF